jgi:hypothetical protein
MYCVDRNVRRASARRTAGGHQAGHRLDVEAGEGVDPLVDLAELGHPLGGQGQRRGPVEVGPAGVAAVLAAQLAGHDAPHLVFLGRVLDVGDGVAAAVALAASAIAPRRSR